MSVSQEQADAWARLGYGANGCDMMTGEARFRQFTSKIQWINKAQTWMRNGDICVDADGNLIGVGKSFDNCAYPVTILRALNMGGLIQKQPPASE